jgi:hypothetical protein
LSQGEIFLTDRLKDSSWNLAHRQSTPFGRQTGQVITYGQPFWMATFRYENLSEAGLRSLSGWLARREGSRVTFTAFRPTRRKPAGGATANTGVTIASIDVATGVIDLTGLPHALQAGDMFSYYTAANGYHCGEISLVTGFGSGAQSIQTKPGPVTAHASSPAPRIVEALAEFQLEGQPQISEPHDRRYSVQFTARQVERA